MEPSTHLLVSWRGRKIEFPLVRCTSVASLKSNLAQLVDESFQITADDIKLFYKGNVIDDDDADLCDVLLPASGKSPKTIRLMATGVSAAEAETRNKEFEEGLRAAPRVRDDLTDRGRAELARRKEVGRRTLAKAAARNTGKSTAQYGFGTIETLPNLPEEENARKILTSLSNDPGILACMAKHKWNVGCLAEMYPEGKVGESEVCVMGLNQNKGQKILLRLRTDDLRGFRKMLSIRKVLFHELAHNVHSEHDGDFFLLMRQIEKECNEMDWTQRSGRTTGIATSHPAGEGLYDAHNQFEGGIFRLGGNSEELSRRTARDLAAHAAMLRLTAEEEEILSSCGCGRGKK